MLVACVTAIPVGADEIWRGSSLGRVVAASGCGDVCSHLRERGRTEIRKQSGKEKCIISVSSVSWEVSK